MTLPNLGLVVPPGDGRAYYLGSDLYVFKAIGAETGEAYALCEVTVEPQSGTPFHRHSREDEAFYVQVGELQFQLEDQAVVATAGTFLYSPKGQAHQFTNQTATAAKLLIWVTPAGFERFIAEVGQTVAPVQVGATLSPADVDNILVTASRYGIEILPPPTP